MTPAQWEALTGERTFCTIEDFDALIGQCGANAQRQRVPSYEAEDPWLFPDDVWYDRVVVGSATGGPAARALAEDDDDWSDDESDDLDKVALPAVVTGVDHRAILRKTMHFKVKRTGKTQ